MSRWRVGALARWRVGEFQLEMQCAHPKLVTFGGYPRKEEGRGGHVPVVGRVPARWGTRF